MSSCRQRQIAEQNLAHRAFIAYFLGGVVPLVALGVVVERYVLTPFGGPDQNSTIGPVGFLGLFGSIALSVAEFLLPAAERGEGVPREAP